MTGQDSAHREAGPADGDFLVERLRSEIAQLEQAVESHAVIDQAMGVLMAVGSCSPAEAWDVLREASMRTNTKLRGVAALVLEWARTGNLPPALRKELESRLATGTPVPPAGTPAPSATGAPPAEGPPVPPDGGAAP
ncbi:hypothetical protein BJP40_18335 [Streptomyces sp. CC53]|uniref:ANTAR domain-containing protein n=1 Tax=unclassified Streptomyces TaxID=2593676 RepID=UPI0008DD9916|nr:MULTISPECIES: ANTAR domain-containing protein [unclassified Streptomyces]OII64955.1 hypothetical protein BJP40_18335 [Streptomyces sp. CC53]